MHAPTPLRTLCLPTITRTATTKTKTCFPLFLLNLLMPTPAPHKKAVAIGGITIPAEALRWQFVRSQGPGGQHVNKTSTKAELRLNLHDADYLPSPVTRRLRLAAGTQATNSGELIITSQRFREQHRNVADCLTKLSALLASALKTPKARKATQPTLGSRRRRLETKRRRSETKRLRRRVPRD